MGDTDKLVQLVRDVGFPMVVAIWFMVRNDRRQERILDLLIEMAKRDRKKND